MKAFHHPPENLTVRRLARQPLKAGKPNPKILTDLCHEVRAQLTVILLSCDMLRNIFPDIQSEAQLEQLNHIERSSQKIHELIKGILARRIRKRKKDALS